MNESSYKLLKDYQKKKLRKNNEAKMTLYNAFPRKEYERVFMCKPAKEVWHTLIITHQGNSQVKNCKIYLLTQEYEKLAISKKETINSGFIPTRKERPQKESLIVGLRERLNLRLHLQAIQMNQCASTAIQRGIGSIAA
ncbi:hypothetical protein Tco_0397055 [Tanacetum coccineum]